ncbi:sialate O-acetylesterase [Aureliella helgolandensis]|uniref:sialate O-acetylesterase n=1 Tax=Aureliella helgolandensis TaxID=2527968 RepID=UPI0011A282F5|nr:sialate O-acetylesterase [Aureliella helgolandensis]
MFTILTAQMHLSAQDLSSDADLPISDTSPANVPNADSQDAATTGGVDAGSPAVAVVEVAPQVLLPSDKEQFHLFLLAGQSNMAGRGPIAPEDLVTHPRVLSLNAGGEWQPAVAPLHFDKPGMVGVGLGRAFALQYAKDHPEVIVGLVPCAAGGSAISSWTPGGYHPQTKSHPYDDALSRTKLAMQDGVLQGILWHQGESDSGPGPSATYKSNLLELIGRFRQELAAPDVPVIIGQLGRFPGKEWNEGRYLVDASHKEIPRLANHTQFVSSAGLVDKGDQTHFASPSARVFGQRYYQAFKWEQMLQPTLTLAPSQENTRNSEGDFIQLKSGKILFVYSRFTGGMSDHAAAQLVSRSSSDGGRTWSDTERLLVDRGEALNVMSVSLLRLQDGRIALFYLKKTSLADCRPVVCYSSDEAKTWTPPAEIIPAEHVAYYVLNNDRVVQLSSGRIVVPVALHGNVGEKSQTDWAGKLTTYQSDDGGVQWHASQTLQPAHAPDGSRVHAQEPGILELNSGRLMMWFRTNAGEQYQCFSDDEGETWGATQPMGLASPTSPASIERIPSTGDLLAVWNDLSHLEVEQRKLRTPLAVAISQDEGQSWTTPQPIASDPQGWYCYTAIDFVSEPLAGHDRSVQEKQVESVLLAHVAGRQQAGQHLATTQMKRLSIAELYRRCGLPWLLESRRIWDVPKHSAFTDLVRFQGQWFGVFREGASHVSPDGALRVISSVDGQSWQSSAVLTHATADLRDAKLTVTPDQQLMLSGAAAWHDRSQHSHQSMSWFSGNGTDWSDAIEIGDPDYWMWRATWGPSGEGAAMVYNVGYATGKADGPQARLYRSADGRNYETLMDDLGVEDNPNESSMLFDQDGTCYCLLRRGAGSQSGVLGRASAPYTEWTWSDLEIRIGGPHMIRIPDGRVVAAVRLYDGRVRTSLCWVDLQAGALTEFMELPSGGDTSYPGLYWHEDRLWVSYYSSHESQDNDFLSAIYMAQVAIPGSH